MEKRTPILIFALALTLRIALTWYHIAFGVQSQSLGTLYPFADFQGYIQPQLEFLTQGLLPYRDFGYSLMPLFLYTLYPFYLFGGTTAATIPILGADALVPVVVYAIVRETGNEYVGLVSGLAYALSPLALFYEGLIWMDSEPALLLALLSIYFIQRARPSLSVIALGVAVLFNQSVLALVPVPILWHLRVKKSHLPRSSFLFLGTLVVGSLPFLLLAPIPFLHAISYGILGAFNPGPGFHYVGGNLNFTPISNSSLLSSLSRIESLQASGTCTGVVNLLTDVETCAANGTIFYSVNHPQSILGALSLFSDKVGGLLMGVLAILLIPAIWAVRKASNFYLIASAFSSLILLILFTFEVHPIYRYYLLFPYVILLAGSIDWRTLTVPIAVMTLSVFTPEGNFQLILILGALLAFIGIQSASLSAGSQAPTSRLLEGSRRLSEMSRLEGASTSHDQISACEASQSLIELRPEPSKFPC